MEKRTLGTSSLSVSKICLGTMTRGYQNTENEAYDQLAYALDRGINFMDTAEVYAIPPQAETQGTTEKYIGNWLQKSGTRDQWIIATKMTGRGMPWIREASGLVAKSVETAIEGSLKRLQTEYIDLYQLHRPQRNVPLWGKLDYPSASFDGSQNNEDNFKRLLEALHQQFQKGTIKHIGLSNETAWGTMKFLQLAKEFDLPTVQTIQNAYNFVRREFDSSLSEVCLEENVSLLAYSPLAGGILSGKYQNGARPEGARYSTWGKNRMPQYVQERVFTATQKYIDLASRLGTTPTKLAIARVTQQPFVGSNIIGATTMKQLEECIDSHELILDHATLQEIDMIHGEQFNPACF